VHIPDGFLDTKTWGGLTVISTFFLFLAIKRSNQKLGERTVPLLGVTAAFIFAAQMFNFPIGGGTSGHFMGAALAAILLGPFAGVLVMSTVLIVQCLAFQDGGLTALGANIFNMGIVGSFLSYYLFKALQKITGSTTRGQKFLVNAFIASWFSIVAAASCCAVELALSKTVPLKLCLPTMFGFHLLIGIGEGTITFFTLGLIRKVRGDLLNLEKI
jgi:cobalt/nickel transport system permease protein